MGEHAVFMDVKRFAVHDGPGIRTTIFLKGCPLKCLWCHNPEGILGKPQLSFYEHKCINCGECIKVCPTNAHSFSRDIHMFDYSKCRACGECEKVCLGDALKLYGKEFSVEEAVSAVLEDKDFFGETGGVTLSGGEPMLQVGFVSQFLTAVKKHNIHTAIDTSGCVPWEYYEQIVDTTDLFLYDVKHMDSNIHRSLTGKGNERILENLRKLSERRKRIEIRIPLIPGCNDTIENLTKVGEFLSTLCIEKVRVLPYHSMARIKYKALNMEDTMPNVMSPTDDQVQSAIEVLRRWGLNVTR